MNRIYPVVVPTWGLGMEEGTLVGWRVEIGDLIHINDELIDIETSKTTNVLESAYSGILRTKVGTVGQTYPCGSLIGVIAEEGVGNDEIQAFIAEHHVAPKEDIAKAQGALTQTVKVQGKSIQYLRQGEGGTPVLLIHGLGGDLNNWLFVQSALARRRVTFAVDLPGHGGSTKDLTGIRSLSDLSELLRSLLAEMRIDHAHLVAHSMGAALALHMVRQQSDLVASLTLLSPAGVGVPVAPEFLSGLLAAKSRRDITPVLQMLLAHKGRVTRTMADNILKSKRMDGAGAALAHLSELLNREWDASLPILEGLTQPVQLVWGIEDIIIRPPKVGILPRNIPVELLPGVGHMPHLEKSAEVIEIVERALAR